MEFCLDFGEVVRYTALTATLRAVPEKEKAPVAQLDRASDYGSEGLRFESPRACFSQGVSKNAGSVQRNRFFCPQTPCRECNKCMGASRFRLNIRGAGCMWRLIGWPP